MSEQGDSEMNTELTVGIVIDDGDFKRAGMIDESGLDDYHLSGYESLGMTREEYEQLKQIDRDIAAANGCELGSVFNLIDTFGVFQKTAEEAARALDEISKAAYEKCTPWQKIVWKIEHAILFLFDGTMDATVRLSNWLATLDKNRRKGL